MRVSFRYLILLVIVPLVAACGTDSGDGAGGQAASDAAGSVDAGSQQDGALSVDSLTLKDGGGAVKDGGGAVEDGGGAVKDGGGAVKDGGGAKISTCSALADCVAKDCAPDFKDGCADACLSTDNAEISALTKAAPLLACVKDVCLAKVCKDSKDPQVCLDDCMKDQCAGHIVKCVDGGKVGKKACASAIQCFDDCSMAKVSTPFACMGACVDALDEAGHKQLTALGECGIAEGSIQKCVVESVKCLTGGKVGDKPCGYFMKCQAECEKDKKGDDCVVGCISELNEEALKLFKALSTCKEKGGDKAQCQEIGFQCALHEQSGPMMCYEVFDCSAECVAKAVKAGATKDEAEDQCVLECGSQLTVADQKLFLDMAPCLGETKDATCDAKLMACIAPSGTATCQGNVDCVGKCPDLDAAPGCMFECLHKGSATSSATAMKVLTACGGDGGPSQSCVDSVLICAEPNGEADCVATQSCFTQCVSQSKKEMQPMVCAVSCTASASKTGAKDFGALVLCNASCESQCKGDADPMACTKICLTKSCAKEVMACTALPS